MQPERVENVVFNMTFDSAHAFRHRADIEFISPETKECFGKIEDGATIKLDYKFWVEYFYGITEVLKALRRISKDKKVPLSVSMEELNHGEVLIFNFFKDYKRVVKSVKKRLKSGE